MDEQLREMRDHYEITKLLAAYCRGIDRMDLLAASGVYAHESWDEHGPYSSTGPEFIAGAMERMRSGSTVADSHMLGQTTIAVDGDRAGAETYFVFVGHRHHADRRDELLQLGGRYVDRLVQEDGKWKLKSRICVKDWSVTIPVEQDWLDGVPWIAGGRSNDDPAFAALGLRHSGRPGPA